MDVLFAQMVQDPPQISSTRNVVDVAALLGAQICRTW